MASRAVTQRWVVAAASCFALLAPRTGAAETAAAPPAVAPPASTPTHDSLHVSARVGMGQLWVSFGDYTISGRTMPIALSLGVALTNNLIFFGELYDAKAYGIYSTFQSETKLELRGAGPGLKAYLMPMNVFVSGSLLISRVHFGDGGTDGSLGSSITTNWGLTNRLSVGKEWWAGSRFGLGIAGEVMLGRMSFTSGVTAPEGTYTTRGFSFLFSGSFN